ncbi:MAG TPA: UDP-N-acetylglucosamine 2-epimerase (non-hydrolyzing), partial [Candidatus Polarisedimenticolaceae bacterium]|nr:UDP-N-acetylglucosamine 2-epimerase (non-hydrolyzing) [Candidatus Polarisedimenticolaceae bacterium]
MKPALIVHVAGARPNFMKIAPLMAACAARSELRSRLVHTGQHYDERMSRLFFEELDIPRPDVDLEVGSGSHAAQTALVLQRLEPLLVDWRPALVLVVGDVNSTLAAALAASKLGVAVAHVEAGLRSFDRTMPEELNRVVTDAIADLLFVSEPAGLENLAREGVDPRRVHFVGNVMIDTLLAHRQRARASAILEQLGVAAGAYAVLTLHRPANVDDPATLGGVLGPIIELSTRLPVIFPVHPRAQAAVARALGPGSARGVRVVAPLGYLDFLRLMMDARLVLTDSGGIQEETTVLGVPCLTLRENTERPVTVTDGTNRIVGSDPERIVAAWRDVVTRNGHPVSRPPL